MLFLKSFRFVWLFLFSSSAVTCVVLCIGIILDYHGFPTVTTVTSTGNDIIYPDVTLCNQRGIDLSIFHSILRKLRITTNVTKLVDLKLDDANPLFEKAFMLAFKNLAPVVMALSESQTQSEKWLIDQILTRTNLQGYLDKDVILNGAVPNWQIVLYCTYGKFSSIIAWSNFIKERLKYDFRQV